MRLEDDEVYIGLGKEMSQQETRKASSHNDDLERSRLRFLHGSIVLQYDPSLTSFTMKQRYANGSKDQHESNKIAITIYRFFLG